MTPQAHISADGRVIDIGALVSVTVDDTLGSKSDAVVMQFSAAKPIATPRHGVELAVSLGYRETGVYEIGRYLVDEVSRSGPPDVLVVRGKGTDMRRSLKAPKDRSWDGIPLGDLLATIASEHGLEARISDELASTVLPHIDQASESDLQLLTRIGKEVNATVRPSVRTLALVVRGTDKRVSREPLPKQAVSLALCESWGWTQADRSRYDGVVAKWHDTDAADVKEVAAGQSGADAVVFKIPRKYATKKEASLAAASRWEALRRGTVTVDLSLTLGNPQVLAGSPLTLADFPAPEIHGSWIAATVRHTYDSGGFKTRITAEPPRT